MLDAPQNEKIMNDFMAESASAVTYERESGVPPYEWITEKIAPELGYKSGDDKTPIIEYYGYYDSLKNKHEFENHDFISGYYPA